jgi:16S rRNA (cytidine1402-2'-O)-methyltransferase
LAKNRQIRKEDEAAAVDAAALRQAILDRLEDVLAQPLEPGLYIVATPIGHLADLTLRAVRTLAGADSLYCEDTRHSRQMLEKYGVFRTLKPYHEHNADRERPRILDELAAGKTVAVISDAGTPLVSDPGFKLVREAVRGGHRVVSVPGPTAPIAALIASGLPTDCFLFAGFLPSRVSARRARLQQIAAIDATLIFFEAPSRVAEALADMAAVLGPQREAAIARELTKLHEEVRRGPLGELAAVARDIPQRGEFVLLIGPPAPVEISDEEVMARLAEALDHASLRDASREVAEVLGVSRARVYDLAVRMKRGCS